MKKFANSRYDGFCRNSKNLLETSKVLSLELLKNESSPFVSVTLKWTIEVVL
ncbi:hypothetical protein LEP1GSC082_4531 [Leptospira kirschneri str. H2]|uniref:Uncharacterized protein n=1 Tax=Leptospira kirschneri serovar Bulgarica str. Nikolaevo TaxID=1240687 RepID=M6EWC6_9LEPT|nr:hypothetical protein LEP1GSC082_4531 [Leptospira kirschneri str. H2]EMK20788.1 hypothetical protein LEP1GSC008_1238 [Leptospira kirschneri serovar Bulgarica str. Nikolaevo]